jgi:hypothetical protein
MNPARLVVAAALLPLAGCYQFQITAQGGYTEMSVGGDLALASTPGGSGVTVDQSVEDALGLGEEQGSPYGRVQIDFGVPVLTVSAFTFQEDGRGRLNASFGNIAGGTDVFTDLAFDNFKASYAFDIDFGPIKVAPGIACDVFNLDVHVQDVAGFATEDLEVLAPVPMGFLRVEADLGLVGLVAEGGFIKIPKVQDTEGQFLDLEALVEIRPTAFFHLFGGYRMMNLEADGIADDQRFATDLDIRGWVVGGGFRF